MDWAPTRTADSWMFSHSAGVDLLITQIVPSSRGLQAWIEMRWRGNVPAPGLITAARYDLMGSRTVGSLTARVKDAGVETDDDWRHLLQQAVYDVIQDYLSGPEPVVLAEVIPSEATFTLRPLIGSVGATSLTGAGGIGKSLLALAAGCAVADDHDAWIGMKPMRPGPVIQVDWEADADTHAVRVSALAAALGRPAPSELYYIGAEAPLPIWASALARRVAKLQAALVIIDSVMLARGGEAAAAETIAFYLALRQLGCPSLIIDHQSREALDKGKTGAYGSIINDNSARLRWIMRGDSQALTLKPAKGNNFGKLPQVHLALQTEGPPERMTSARWVHVESPPPSGGITEGVIEVLDDHPGGLRIEEMARLLDRDPDQFRRVLYRLREGGKIQQVDGRWLPLDLPY